MVGIVASLIKTVPIGTLVEIGTEPGKVTENLCQAMTLYKVTIPLIVSDKSPTIVDVGHTLRKFFRSLPLMTLSGKMKGLSYNCAGRTENLPAGCAFHKTAVAAAISAYL